MCLSQLVGLCAHEYDAIRSSGLKTFDKVSSRFASKIEPTLKSLIASLANPNQDVNSNSLVEEECTSSAMYAKLSSTLHLLARTKLLHRLEDDWHLTEPFLLSLSNSQAVISRFVTESDKREKVIKLLFSNHIPIV